ncbi:MAG: chitobiase/beta-hexosaminidase C-terminal domain-containing protein [Muribaculaceae bacterium]|nr:chitobiase/beta-hexosaminidase C-terminal domain-containing protein [Muribaculaceae bacterium]
MKKILLSLLVAVASLSAYAAEATVTTLDFANPSSMGYTNPVGTTGEAQYTLIDVTKGITVAPIQIDFTNKEGAIASNSAKFWNGATFIDLRIYKGATITFKTTNGNNITKMVFSCNAVAAAMFDSGSYVYDSTTKLGTWTGDAATVKIAPTATIKLYNAEISTSPAGALAAPVITPNGGTFYGPTAVTMSCPTDGATIKYSIDGADAVTYSGEFQITKSCQIIAQSFLGSEKSILTTADFVIETVPGIDNIAAFYLLENDAAAQFKAPLTAVAQIGNNLIVKDNTGFMLIYGATGKTYNNGDVIAAGVKGKVALYGNQKQLNPIAESFADGVAGNAVAPTVVTTATIEALDQYLNHYIVIKDATLTLVEGKTRNYTIADAAGTFAAYDNYKIDMTALEAGAKYDIIGVAGQFNTTKQVNIISFGKSGAVDGVTAQATTIVANFGTIDINAAEDAQALVVNAAGQIVASKAVTTGANTIAVAPGFYIVKVGATVAKVIVK